MTEESNIEIGIYRDIHKSGNKDLSGHSMYYCTCKECGKTVEKLLGDIKRAPQHCTHNRSEYAGNKINDMPRGWISKSDFNKRIYYLWKSMFYRTTPKFWKDNPTYEGTTASEEWRKLSNFVRDIKTLQGYDFWKNNPNQGVMLDKDTIVEGNKHYSKETCRFISHADSNRDVTKRHPEILNAARVKYIENHSVPVELTNKKTGEKLRFKSIKDACKEMNLNFRNVYMVISDRYPGHKSCKGWNIHRIDT